MADIEGADIEGVGRNGRVPKRRVAVLISGGGSNLQALLDAAKAPDYPAEIALVVSNVAGVHGLDRATKAQVPTVTYRTGISTTARPSRRQSRKIWPATPST